MALREFFIWERLHLVISVSGNKDLDGIVRGARAARRRRLRRTERRANAAATRRRSPSGSRAEGKPVAVFASVAEALDAARAAAGEGDLILVTGSLYTVADARRALGLHSLRRRDMTIESTLLIVKPDGVQRGLVGEVLRRVEAKGLHDRGAQAVHDPARDRRGALRRAPRQAVLRRAGRLHHRRPGRGGEDHRRGRHHLLAHADGTDEPGGGPARVRSAATSPPRSARTSCTAATRRSRPRASSSCSSARSGARPMPGLSEAFERIGAALEHHLPPEPRGRHRARRHRPRGDPRASRCAGFADAASGQPVRPETRFEIGSISKSFAAAVVMQEVEEGRLDLHVSINEILPWLELPEPFGPITLHHLLTHTSGLADRDRGRAHRMGRGCQPARAARPRSLRGSTSGTPTTATSSSGWRSSG